MSSEKDTARYVAYAAAEFGVEDFRKGQKIPIYNGGLGSLAGCHLITAADIGYPIDGIGLMYKKGCFTQVILPDGSQCEIDSDWNPSDYGEKMKETIKMKIKGYDIDVGIWKFEVPGRSKSVNLYLLEANGNGSIDTSEINGKLYQGPRLEQDFVLGIGTVRLMHDVLGKDPIFHMNDAHSAAIVLELMKRYRIEEVRDRCVYTCHTFQPAAMDMFRLIDIVNTITESNPIIDFSYNCLKGDILVSMPDLAMYGSRYVNGVAEKNRTTAKELNIKTALGNPIDSITNGVHAVRWTGDYIADIWDNEKETSGWRDDPSLLKNAKKIENIEEKLLRAHKKQKESLIEYVKERTSFVYDFDKRCYVYKPEASVSLDPDSIIIAAGRRFAGYKRMYLMLRDFERFYKILEKFDAQLIMGGKAHPNDVERKKTVKYVNECIKEIRRRGRNAVFIENWDQLSCHKVTAGADIWVNTPFIPHEQCGTSGMCAALNGTINLTTLDGWYPEISSCNNGIWEIKGGYVIGTDKSDDDRDMKSFLDLLEEEILPSIKKEKHTKKMIEAVSDIGSYYNSHRMLKEYIEKAYNS